METQKRPGLKDKITGVINTTKAYWHVPPKGQYVSYKEVGFLSGAGFGVHWMMLLASAISLTVGNYIVGASINIEGVHLQLMLNIANIIGIPIGIFRGRLFGEVTAARTRQCLQYGRGGANTQATRRSQRLVTRRKG